MKLDVEGLAAGYRDGVPVIEDIDLSVDSGAVGVIGRNGAGKSCLAQALSGSLRPTAGTLRFDGADIAPLQSRARVQHGICLVPEGRQVFGQLTVRENLAVAAYSAGKSMRRESDLEGFFPVLAQKRSHRAASLSGGEQQLLAIARALIQEPRLLILDEPSLGLSPIAIENLANVLRDVRAELGIAMVLMEQNSELLTSLCQDVLLLEDGRIVRTLDMRSEPDRQALVSSYMGV